MGIGIANRKNRCDFGALRKETVMPRIFLPFPEPRIPGSEGPKGGRRKGGRGRKLSHFSFCCAFRCCVVYSPCFPVWGEEKVMTIYDAGPLAAGPLCGLLTESLEVKGKPAKQQGNS